MGLAVLLIEDDLGFVEPLRRFLTKEGHSVEHGASGEEGLRLFSERTPDVVLLDLMLPGLDGIEVLERMKALDPSTMIIVMTAHGTVSSAVEAMRRGAMDFVNKPIDLESLSLRLDNASRLRGLHSDLDYLLKSDQKNAGFDNIVGSCPAMQAVFERIREVAKTSNTTVLITGPSGTGKELVARAVHTLSSRNKKPLMEIDCTSIPVSLLESELFGHERGAFTGADRPKKGLLELANGGTLLLDEIGDMAQELQGKLLRVLQERQFRRVGGTHDISLDVRVIAATHQDLEERVGEGRFRKDLFYRLKVFQIELPPLRERGADILEIANGFVREFAKSCRKSVRELDEEAKEALSSYSFPGNVRELRNIIEQAVILAKGELIAREHLSIPTSGSLRPEHASEVGTKIDLDMLGQEPLKAAERLLIAQALERTGGNRKQAAMLLGISRFALQRKLDKLEGAGGG